MSRFPRWPAARRPHRYPHPHPHPASMLRAFLSWVAARRPHPVRMLRAFLSWYGAGPLHLLTMAGCFALAGYAAVELLPNNLVGIPVWLIGAVIGHDLLLMPLYTLADRSALAVFRHRKPALPDVAWINYLRVPAALSGMLLLIWFPLIFRLPARFPATTTLPLDPYLWHWLGVTGGLFLLSAAALALRLRTSRTKPSDLPPGTGPTPVR